MDASTTHPARFRSIVGRWRALSHRRRFLILALAASLAAWGGWRVYRWCTSWPARLILRAESDHGPFAWSPDGATLVTRTLQPSALILWDAKTGQRRATWKRPDGRILLTGSFSPDGATFAVPWVDPRSTKNFSVDLIDVESGRARSPFESTFVSPFEGLLGLAFQDGGRVLRLVATSGTELATVDVEVATGRILASRTRPGPPGSSIQVVSTDGRRLASSSLTGLTGPTTVTIRDLDADRDLFVLPGVAGRMGWRAGAFSPDDRLLALGFDDGSIAVWDLASKTLRSKLPAHSRNYVPIFLRSSPDGSTLASMAILNRRVHSFDLIRFYVSSLFREPHLAMPTELILLDVATGRRRVVSRDDGPVVFSPDGRSVASGQDDGQVRIHDLPPLR